MQKSKTSFYLRIALVILPGIQYNTRQCLGQTKRALCTTINFLFYSFQRFSHFTSKKEKKSENQVFFCKQARRETLISLRSSSLFAQLLVWRGRWFLPIRYLKPIYFTVDNTILKYKDYTSAWTLGKRFLNNSDSLFDCGWKTTHDAPETITVHYYRAETEILVSTV